VWLTPHLRDPQPEGEREEVVYEKSIGTTMNDLDLCLEAV